MKNLLPCLKHSSKAEKFCSATNRQAGGDDATEETREEIIMAAEVTEGTVLLVTKIVAVAVTVVEPAVTLGCAALAVYIRGGYANVAAASAASGHLLFHFLPI